MRKFIRNVIITLAILGLICAAFYKIGWLTSWREVISLYIIAFIDDASRLVTSCIAFFEDNYVNLMQVLKKGVSTYGKPKVLSLDNGSNYRSSQMELLGARIGVAINYCPPYTPTSKSYVKF